MTDYTSQINQIYQDIQFQNGSASEVAQYNAGLISGALTLTQVTGDIEQEPYTLNVVDPVIREYQAAFGRVPDQAGLKYWVGQVASNPNALVEPQRHFRQFRGVQHPLCRERHDAGQRGSCRRTLRERAGTPAGRRRPRLLVKFQSRRRAAAAGLLAIVNEFIADTAAAITVYQNGEAAVPPSIPTTGSLLDLTPASPQTITLTTGVDTPSLTANGNTINGTFNGSLGNPRP